MNSKCKFHGNSLAYDPQITYKLFKEKFIDFSVLIYSFIRTTILKYLNVNPLENDQDQITFNFTLNSCNQLTKQIQKRNQQKTEQNLQYLNTLKTNSKLSHQLYHR